MNELNLRIRDIDGTDEGWIKLPLKKETLIDRVHRIAPEGHRPLIIDYITNTDIAVTLFDDIYELNEKVILIPYQ